MEKLETIAEQLFGEALDLSLERRAAFLDAACRGSPDVRQSGESPAREDWPMSGSGSRTQSTTIFASFSADRGSRRIICTRARKRALPSTDPTPTDFAACATWARFPSRRHNQSAGSAVISQNTNR